MSSHERGFIFWQEDDLELFCKGAQHSINNRIKSRTDFVNNAKDFAEVCSNYIRAVKTSPHWCNHQLKTLTICTVRSKKFQSFKIFIVFVLMGNFLLKFQKLRQVTLKKYPSNDCVLPVKTVHKLTYCIKTQEVVCWKTEQFGNGLGENNILWWI